MVGQHHGVQLHGVDDVGVVADDAREPRLPDLGQLFGRERRRLVGELVPGYNIMLLFSALEYENLTDIKKEVNMGKTSGHREN